MNLQRAVRRSGLDGTGRDATITITITIAITITITISRWRWKSDSLRYGHVGTAVGTGPDRIGWVGTAVFLHKILGVSRPMTLRKGAAGRRDPLLFCIII